MTTLPEDLSEDIQTWITELANSSTGALDLARRRMVWSHIDSSFKAPQARTFRYLLGRSAVLSAREEWRTEVPEDEGRLDQLLHTAKNIQLGQESPANARKLRGRMWTFYDDLSAGNPGDFLLRIGYGAAKLVTVAYADEPLASPQLSHVTEPDIDPTQTDVPFDVSCGLAGGTPWGHTNEQDSRAAFWRNYLGAWVPRIWDALQRNDSNLEIEDESGKGAVCPDQQTVREFLSALNPDYNRFLILTHGETFIQTLMLPAGKWEMEYGDGARLWKLAGTPDGSEVMDHMLHFLTHKGVRRGNWTEVPTP